MTVLTPRSETRGSGLRILRLVMGVAAAYYVGGLLGLLLRPPGTTPSVFWPPNALLTAALLLSPPRLWPICIGAALPPHLAAELAAGWSLSFSLAIFTTNCLEALLAAAGIRYLSDAPDRFDSLRRLAIFLAIAVIAAPLISTFADAAIVHWLRHEPYWRVWKSRLASNLLSQLAITPAAIAFVRGLPEWLRRAPRRRQLEAAALGVSLGLSLALAVWLPLGVDPSGESVKLVVARTPLLVSLPFLLWAAMRFHTAGASLAFLVMALGTAWAAVHGQWLAAVPISDSKILAVQLLLVVVGVTLLIVGTVIAERDRTARDLAENLWFHALLSQLSATFVQMPGERLESTVDVWLGRLGQALHLRRRARRALHRARSAAHHRVDVVRERRSVASLQRQGELPLDGGRTARGKTGDHRRRTTASRRGRRRPRGTDRSGMGSVLILPLVAEHQVLGTIGFGCHAPRAWPDSIVSAHPARLGRVRQRAPAQEDRRRAHRQRGDEVRHRRLAADGGGRHRSRWRRAGGQ